MIITNLTPSQMQAFKDVTKSLYDKWVPQIGKELYDLAVAYMK